jgi:hypothetical protein
MRKLFLATAAVISIVSTAAAGQLSQRTSASASPAKKTAAYPAISMNTSQGNVLTAFNLNQAPLIVVARCNATIDRKDLEGWVSQTAQASVADMVASQSGTERQSITFVVPWGWNFQVHVVVPAGGSCSATGWLAG